MVVLGRKKVSRTRMAIIWPTQEYSVDRSKGRRGKMLLAHVTESQLHQETIKK